MSAVLAIGLITYTSRAGLIVFLADRPLPANVTRALRYVGPAVLSALTVNLIAGGKGASGVEAAEVAAIAAAIVVVSFTRNLIAALGAGMVTLWVIGAVRLSFGATGRYQGNLPTWARARRIRRSWPPVIWAMTSSLTASSGVNQERSRAFCVGSQSPSTGTT